MSGNSFTAPSLGNLLQPPRPARKPTPEEAEAILTLVRGGWLKLTLALDDDA